MSNAYQAIKTVDGDTLEQHPSYAVIQISKGQGTPRVLFDSSIKHGETITLSICHAERQRHLNQHWIHGKKEIIEVEMSPEQFTQMITHMNHGTGTPCTLKHVNMERIPSPPYNDPITEFRREFASDVQNVATSLDTVIDALQTLVVDKRASMTAMRDILGRMKGVRQAIVANLPFVTQQFDRHMEHTVTEAKAAVDAFVTSLAMRGDVKNIPLSKVAELPSIEEGSR